MAWLSRHWKLIFAVGIIILLGGSTIIVEAVTGVIENRINIEGESASNFTNKSWYPFSQLTLNEGDNATFYFDMHPTSESVIWGLFLYLTNSTGGSVYTKIRTSEVGGAIRRIELPPFIAPYTDTYNLRADASSHPPNSLEVYPRASIKKVGPNAMVLTFGVMLFSIGIILIAASLLRKPQKA